jgi:hypothetical protein
MFWLRVLLLRERQYYVLGARTALAGMAADTADAHVLLIVLDVSLAIAEGLLPVTDRNGSPIFNIKRQNGINRLFITFKNSISGASLA